jgi:hypothetical protein
MRWEAVTVMPSCRSGGNVVGVIFIPLTVVRVWFTVVLKEPFLGWRRNSVARLNSVFGLEKVDQKSYNSFMKPTETMQWDELRFSSGGSALETENVKDEPRTGKPSTAPVPLSSWSLRQTVCSTFSRSGWSVVRSASLTKRGTSKKETVTTPPQSSDSE